jgi:hypothetical protein
MFIGVSPLRELDGTNLVKADCEVIQPGFHRTLEIPARWEEGIFSCHHSSFQETLAERR